MQRAYGPKMRTEWMQVPPDDVVLIPISMQPRPWTAELDVSIVSAIAWLTLAELVGAADVSSSPSTVLAFAEVERNKERCRPTAHEDLAPVAEVLNSHGVLAQLEHTSCARAQSELDSGRMWAHSLLHGRSWHRLSAHTVYMKLACALTRKA